MTSAEAGRGEALASNGEPLVIQFHASSLLKRLFGQSQRVLRENVEAPLIEAGHAHGRDPHARQSCTLAPSMAVRHSAAPRHGRSPDRLSDRALQR